MWKKLVLIFAVLGFYIFAVFSCQPHSSNFTSNVSSSNNSAITVPVSSKICPDKTTPFLSYDNESESYEVNGNKQMGRRHDPPEWWCQKNLEENAKGQPLEHPIFQLRQDYPSASPLNIEQPWKKFDFKDSKQWKDYLKAVLRYAYEGNIEVDWTVRENKADRKWFHTPWMHFGARGREFIHGLTNERCSCEKELIPQKDNETGELKVEGCATLRSSDENILCHPSTPIQNWAISIYNEPGGYYLKRIWDEVKSPTPNFAEFAELTKRGFPEGTVSIKLLFTQANPDKVEYLKNSIVWKADINRIKANPDKPPEDLHLLQIDVSVRDGRSPIGWVFGTFIYNDKSPVFLEKFTVPSGKEAWLHVEPVGLMYGNDRGEFPKISEPKESIINDALEVKPHLGCGGRLNGAVDNFVSSCVSCHALSETPKNLKISSLPHFNMKCTELEDIAYWMKNINPRSSRLEERTFTACSPDGTILPSGNCVTNPAQTPIELIYSLDYSLQLREGIKRYCSSNPENCKVWADNSQIAVQSLLESEETQISRDGITGTNQP